MDGIIVEVKNSVKLRSSLMSLLVLAPQNYIFLSILKLF